MNRENVNRLVWTLDHPKENNGVENGYLSATAALFLLLCETPLNIFFIAIIIWKKLCKSASVIPMLNFNDL